MKLQDFLKRCFLDVQAAIAISTKFKEDGKKTIFNKNKIAPEGNF